MPDIPDRARRLAADIRICLAFFTRLPVRAAGDGTFELGRSAGGWPLVGALVGAGAGLALLVALAAGMPRTVAAVLAVATLIALTGAMHEDGLSDTADGLGGGRSAEQKREIMRDSRLGTYGALALILTFSTRVGALAALAAFPAKAALALVLAAVLSRSMAVWHWRRLPPARSDGLAWSAGRPDERAMLGSSGIGTVAGLVTVIVFGTAALLGIALAALAVAGLTGLCRNGIGGHTGDTIGAAQQVTEALILAGLSAALPALVL